MRYSVVRMAAALLLSMVLTAAAGCELAGAAAKEPRNASWEKLHPSAAADARLFGKGGTLRRKNPSPYRDSDTVRVLIYLEDSAPGAGHELETARRDPLTARYQKIMTLPQALTATRISREVLEGELMDVVQSYGPPVNAISVNAEFSKVDSIAKVQGVRQVLLERRYEILNRGRTLPDVK